MGSYISVGLVYLDTIVNEDVLFLIKELQCVCDMIAVSYPKDDLYERWEEKTFQGMNGFVDAFMLLDAKKMSSGKMYCKIKDNNYNVLVKIREENDKCKGFLFEIPEEELLRNGCTTKNLEKVTNEIAKNIIQLWNKMRFSYAFCDSEADIESTLYQFDEDENPKYSLLLLKDKQAQPVIKLSSWCIDGITPRK